MVLTNEEIRERIRIQDTWITTERTEMLPAAVGESLFRFVVAIALSGDQQQNRTVDIEKEEEDASFTMKWSNIPVAPANYVHLMPNYNIEQPIIVLQGGSSLFGSVSGNSLQAMVHYWDDEI